MVLFSMKGGGGGGGGGKESIQFVFPRVTPLLSGEVSLTARTTSWPRSKFHQDSMSRVTSVFDPNIPSE